MNFIDLFAAVFSSDRIQEMANRKENDTYYTANRKWSWVNSVGIKENDQLVQLD